MTRSEIPQFEVVTAISDVDSEDFVAQLLFSQGWSIIHRAFDIDSLTSFMSERGQEMRTIIVYQGDFPGATPEYFASFATPTVTLISLDLVQFNSHEIMLAIRNKLRAPMVQANTQIDDETPPQPNFQNFRGAPPMVHPSPLQTTSPTISINKRFNRAPVPSNRARKVIAITGSSGAPGKTRFSLVLAEELAQQSSILLIDADIRSHTNLYPRDFTGKNRVELVPLDRESRPTRLPDGDGIAVVDLGTLPGLTEAVTDRRWHGSLVNNVLDSATHLIYMSKSTPGSMAELAQFLREYPLLLKKLPVSYICILAGHSRELREWESKFLTLTMGENRFVLRDSQLEPIRGGVLGGLNIGSSKRKEIAKIAASLG